MYANANDVCRIGNGIVSSPSDTDQKAKTNTAEFPVLETSHRHQRHRVKFVGSLVAGALLLASPLAHASKNTAALWIGSTPAQIQSKFAANMQAAMSGPHAAAAFNGLTDLELRDVASMVPTDMSAAILAHIGTAAKSRYALARTKGPIVPIPPTLGAGGALDSTLLEIYYDFRLFGGALYGPLSAEAALYSTAVFGSVSLGSAFTAGYTAGSAVSWLWQRVDLNSWQALGSLEGQLVSLVNDLVKATAADLISQVSADEMNLDSVFQQSTSDYVFYSDSYGLEIGPWGEMNFMIGCVGLSNGNNLCGH